MTITDPAVSAHADATIGLFEITDHITIDSTQVPTPSRCGARSSVTARFNAFWTSR